MHLSNKGEIALNIVKYDNPCIQQCAAWWFGIYKAASTMFMYIEGIHVYVYRDARAHACMYMCVCTHIRITYNLISYVWRHPRGQEASEIIVGWQVPQRESKNPLILPVSTWNATDNDDLVKQLTEAATTE